FSVRNAGPEQKYVRVTNFVYPNAFCIPTQGGWHVPIDDSHHWKYQIMRSPTPLDRDKLKQDMLLTMTPDYHHLRKRANRYIRDPARNNLSHLISIQEVVPNSVDWRNHWRTRVAEQAAMLPAR